MLEGVLVGVLEAVLEGGRGEGCTGCGKGYDRVKYSQLPDISDGNGTISVKFTKCREGILVLYGRCGPW